MIISWYFIKYFKSHQKIILAVVEKTLNNKKWNESSFEQMIVNSERTSKHC